MLVAGGLYRVKGIKKAGGGLSRFMRLAKDYT